MKLNENDQFIHLVTITLVMRGIGALANFALKLDFIVNWVGQTLLIKSSCSGQVEIEGPFQKQNCMMLQKINQVSLTFEINSKMITYTRNIYHVLT